VELRSGRCYRTKQERRQIAEETLKPGASVARVARAHEVNANQVFLWRKQYREGWFDEAQDKPTALVPVKISGVVGESLRARERVSKPAASTSGSIEIELGHARVRIEGAADPECVRAALEGLVR
jgi:transposase